MCNREGDVLKNTTFQENDLIDKIIKKKPLSSSLRILIPLYTTYTVFILSIFLIFIPQQERQLLNQKKETILQLTENVISLLSEINSRVEQGIITPEKARLQAIEQIRNLRYGPEGKDYFWINDMHPIMIMHPYRPDLEGQDLTSFQDAQGEYPFIAMVKKAAQNEGGYVKYYWQWKDTPQKIVPKLSYIKRFPAWNWIVGTGLYTDDIHTEISLITRKFVQIFAGILVFIVILSIYISKQVFKIEQKKEQAEKEKEIETLRLKKSEARYRLLADNATDTIWIIQLSDFTYLYISPSIQSLQGYSPEEFTGAGIRDYVTEPSLKAVSRIISEELARESDPTADPERTRVIEMEMVKKDGSTVWVEITARFLRNDSGEPDRILGITRDIHQRKMLEKELIASNTALRHAQRIANIGNIFLDPQKNMTLWSEEVYRICEHDPGLNPLSIAEHQSLFSSDDWKKFESAFQTAISDGLSFDLELRLVLPSKNKKWINLIGKPEQERGPWGHCLHGTIQDITERKKMELHIQQVQKMEALGTLAGGIAHDFNNILSSIFGFTELAKLDVSDNADATENLNQVLSAGLRAKELVRHILTFSRRSDIQKDLIQIVPLIKECVKFLKASISPDIKIQTHFIHTHSIVFADPTQLHQVLMNLFTNAAHAMKKNGGVLDITVKSIDILKADIFQLKEIKPGKYVQLTISDTGCGIPKNIIDKIFEPFFTTKVKGEGTGLGLSLTYGIIKGMQGNISVYSEPGMGATFQVLIPEQANCINENEMTIDRFPVKGRGNILIVDDETAITKWTSQVLSRLGYKVICENHGPKALELFNDNPMKFDLILTDLTMPDMTGLELSSHISAKRPDIPIILCTGFSEGLTFQKIKAYGIYDMIMKPMIASELALIINKALTRKSEPHD